MRLLARSSRSCRPAPRTDPRRYARPTRMPHSRRQFLVTTSAAAAVASCSGQSARVPHVVLLGDSIFDNAQ
ncbi:MAG: twin-arginine translocation signal domain-containing protein, partial [Planctomycetes bacterium]|nr:twin-arginine translocation signal domain-containing protein [Planctomycetota bacterium]